MTAQRCVSGKCQAHHGRQFKADWLMLDGSVLRMCMCWAGGSSAPKVADLCVMSCTCVHRPSRATVVLISTGSQGWPFLRCRLSEGPATGEQLLLVASIPDSGNSTAPAILETTEFFFTESDWEQERFVYVAPGAPPPLLALDYEP